MTAIAANLVFIVSYVFFMAAFIKVSSSVPYAFYVLPLAVYSALAAFSFLRSMAQKTDFSVSFRELQKFLVVFALLTGAPLLAAMNFPEPHNFILRKYELAAGSVFTVFIVFMLSFTAAGISRSGLEKESLKRNFRNIFLVFFVFYSFISLWFNYANEPTGDEPIYLMTSVSMLRDRDLDLRNNYVNEDYKEFYSRQLKPQEVEVNGKLYSYHPVLVSVIIAPFYAIGKRLGVTVLFNILTALFTALIFLFITDAFGKKRTAMQAAFITGVSMPVIMYSNQICTEIVNGILVLVSFWLVMFRKDKFYLMNAAALLLPWAHPRNGILWVAIALMVLIEYRKHIRKVVVFAAVQAASLAMFVAFNFSVYGVPVPGQTHGQQPLSEVFSFRPDGLLGMFIDQEFGLFAYTPLFALCIAGAWYIFKNNRKLAGYLALLFIPYYIMVSSWTLWNAGGGASARFIVPVIFVFSACIAAVKDGIRTKAALHAYNALAWAGFALSFIIIFVPWFRWNKGAGDNWILKLMSQAFNTDITFIFPDLWAKTGNYAAVGVFWLIIVLLLNLLFFLPFKNKS